MIWSPTLGRHQEMTRFHHWQQGQSSPGLFPSTPQPSSTFPVFSPGSRASSPDSPGNDDASPSSSPLQTRLRARMNPGRRAASLFSFRNFGASLPGIGRKVGYKAKTKEAEANDDDEELERGRTRERGGASGAETSLLTECEDGRGLSLLLPKANAPYAARPECTQSTPTLLFTSSSSFSSAVDDDEVDSPVSRGTSGKIRIPFIDDNEMDRLRPPPRQARAHLQHQRHRRNRQHQLSSSSSASRPWTTGSSISGSLCLHSDGGRGRDGLSIQDPADYSDDGEASFQVDTAVRVSMISLGRGRLERNSAASSDRRHPSPLWSNPLRRERTSAVTTTTDVEMRFDNISLASLASGPRRSRPLSQVYDLNLELASVPATSPYQSPLPSPGLAPSCFDGHDEEAELAHVQTTLGELLAAKAALMTLNAAHEQTIAARDNDIITYKEQISELSRQLRECDESTRNELEILDQKNSALRDERWDLVGRVAELEQTIARMEALLRLGGQVDSAEGAEGTGDWPLRAASSADDDSRSTLQCFSPAAPQSPWARSGPLGSPDTIPSSLPSPDSCRGDSAQNFYAASPTPASRSAYSPVRRRQKLPPLLVGEGSGVVCSVEQSGQDMIPVDNIHNGRLQLRSALQDALSQELTSPVADASPMAGPLPIPELPVLTYNKSAAVWLDRISTIFRYLGLLEFVHGGKEEYSPSVVRGGPDWSARRLRAAVLLKHAIDDAILEDVLYLHKRREALGNAAGTTHPFHSSPATDDPVRLLSTILTLSRTMPTSPTDLSWVEQIESSDFEGSDGFEGFASLVLCIDRRIGMLYGTSSDHYESLLPKIQECMAKLFPEQRRMALWDDSESNVPRKRWQLTVWMAKVVKKRRVGGC